MKSNTKKRLIAFMLCMVLVLSSATSAFADEPQNTDSQSQAEVVTEPAADEATEDTTTEDTTTEDTTTEDTTTEDTTTEDTTTEDVSTENTITEDVSDTPDIEIPSKKEWSVQVGNATVKVNGSADALPADAQLSVTEITSEDEVKEIEKAVEEKAIEEQFSIKNIFSYDIKFLVNGSEVQPTTPVQVSVDTPEITSSENAAVLHVDDNNVAEDMKGAVDGEGKVVFDAPHFSKYVIVQKGNSKVSSSRRTDRILEKTCKIKKRGTKGEVFFEENEEKEKPGGCILQCTGHCFTDSTDSCLYSADASESFWFSDVHRDQWEHGTGDPDGKPGLCPV